MNGTSKNTRDGGPQSSPKLEKDKPEKDLCEIWRGRAQNNRKIARNYSVGVGVLFIGACLVVGFADWITRGTVGIASSIAVEGFERPEERLTVTMWQGEDLRGVALDRRNDTVFVVSSGGYILAADSSFGRLHEWEALSSNTRKNFHGIAVSDDGGVVIAAGERGLVRRSVDRGNTWTDAGGVASQDINAVALSGDGKTAVLVGDDGLVRRSDDGGETWANTDIVETEGRRKNVNGVPLNGVALSGDGKTAVLVGDDGLVRRSDDGGKTWVNPSIVETEDRRKDVNAVALSRDGKIAVLVGDNGLAKSSTDGGKTWKSCTTNVGDDLNGVALSGDSRIAVLVGDDGLVLDFDVQEEGCSNVRFGKVVTEHQFYALVLDEDSGVAIVVGEDLMIGHFPRSVERSSPRIETVTVERVRKRLTEEERLTEEQRRAEEEQRREEEAKKARADALSEFAWQVYFYSTSLRVGIIVILMFWVGHLVGLIRYHLRLAAYYDARGDAITLVGERLSSEPDDGLRPLEGMIGLLSPDDVGFSDAKVRHGKLLTLPRAAERAAKEATNNYLQGDER